MISSPTHTTTLTTEDASLAKTGSQVLSSYLALEQSHYQIEVVSEGKVAQKITIPAYALYLLSQALTQMASGHAVTLVPINRELSTSQAAEILNVSRPYLVRLLQSGEIPFRKVGARRRVLYEDVIAYKNQIDAQREQTLAELAAQAQELNMGYE